MYSFIFFVINLFSLFFQNILIVFVVIVISVGYLFIVIVIVIVISSFFIYYFAIFVIFIILWKESIKITDNFHLLDIRQFRLTNQDINIEHHMITSSI